MSQGSKKESFNNYISNLKNEDLPKYKFKK